MLDKTETDGQLSNVSLAGSQNICQSIDSFQTKATVDHAFDHAGSYFQGISCEEVDDADGQLIL